MKATWEPEYHRVFVDLCLEQKMLGNQPGTQHILKPFQQRTGARFTRKQLKNHWDTMIKQWKIWCRLVQCSDMKWDPVTNMFGASDQDWSNYLQVNPEAGQYRLNPPLFLKKLEVIFEDSNFDDEVTPGWKRKRVCKHRGEEYDTGDDDEEEEEREDKQSASNFTSPQSKGYWSPSSHELFVDLLFQEALKGNRPDSHYPKETWKMMLETINHNTGKSFTRPQLKNHWDCTRKGWKIWCQVIGDPMMKWDADTRTFGATDEDWKSYLKVNHRAAVFRRKHILHADKLATIFKGLIEPGKAYFRHYRRRVGDNHHHPESPQLHDPTPLSTLYTNEPVTVSEDRADNDDDDDDDDEPTLQDMRFDGVGFAESRLQDVEIVTPGSHRFSTELSEKIPVNVSVKKYEYTIGECIECLDNMEEVEQGSDLYMFALDLFPTKEYREIFLHLKNSSLRLSWLLRRQSGGLTITA
ncbi:PREDICTED: L10-interacting MYB domain-containing protein-like [Camelina sativa]|uniref:L10-interacting MYB domain-containing protein-like n=1 Tax=Camelina sativa TaxID=90675 RepID=A0ABM0XJ79_CAMSA|nr:PREDICTED: L10-interacting MYB domain-containing protein-like [Camelina sativa]XP_010486781.1 PREDICTED: L10-interacting MYB domain-containing protein-like [Camelina sativa]XP_010486782.1 PREDICTED: L10-interacting MYB domain-containing protein-like [Camelina sativa]